MNDIDRQVPDRLIRAKEVARMTGLGLSTVYMYQKMGMFPGSVRIGSRSVAWSYHAIVQWVEDRKAGIPLVSGQTFRAAANVKAALS